MLFVLHVDEITYGFDGLFVDVCAWFVVCGTDVNSVWCYFLSVFVVVRLL